MIVSQAGPSRPPEPFDELKPNDLVRVRGDFDFAVLIQRVGAGVWTVREPFGRYVDVANEKDIEPVRSYRKPHETGWLP